MPPEFESVSTRFSKNFFAHWRFLCLGAGIILFVLFFYMTTWAAPKDFPVSSSSYYDLAYGQTLSITANDLFDRHIIQSVFWFKVYIYVFSEDRPKVVSGDYVFAHKQNVILVAWRISHGVFDVQPIRVTIPEGLSSIQIASILASDIPSFSTSTFLQIVQTQQLEGYLFPDTYLFLPDVTPSEVIETMHDNFEVKVQTLNTAITAFGQPLSDVIKMASILEGEASTPQSQRIIAGILWKRISLNMPLEVDSSFKYIDGKTSSELSAADLQINSPYNSYTHVGLPPTPISNPGLVAIEDAITPIQTPYLYFLSDSQGNMHYATTFAQQLANEQKYL